MQRSQRSSKLTRRALAWRLGAAGTTAGLVAACGGQVSPSAPASGQSGTPVEVVFMRTANQSLAAAYEAQAEAFNQKQQRLRGRFEAAAVGQGETWDTKLTAMLASDSAPDCFLVSQELMPSLAAGSSLLVLDAYMQRDAKEVDAADFFPSHLAGGKWRGKQVALAPDGCALLTYYNVTLFEAAGVATPKPSWTWNDYLDAARKLTKKDESGQLMQAGAMPVANDNQYWLWLWSNGADLFSADFKQVRVTEKAAIDAVQFVADLVQRHGVTPSSPGANLGPNPQVAGKVAMWNANRGFFGQLQNVTSFKFNVVPFPRSPQTGTSITLTNPGYIAIAASNKHPDAAWEWLKFLTGSEAQIIRSKVQQGGCPSRKSATRDPSYMDYGVPALESTAANKAFADVLSDPKMARFVPQYVGMSDAANIFNKYFNAALQGAQSVPAALDSAKRELEDLLRRQPQPA